MHTSRFTLRQMAHIVLAFGWSDFRLKYRGSFFGFLWSFAFPVFKFLVILNIARRFNPDIEHYPLYLFLGVLLWEHFSLTTSACIALVKDKSVIFQKILFPRIVLVLSLGWQHLIILSIYLSIFVIATALYGIVPGWALLYLPIIAVQCTCLSLGIGMMLGANALRYRDIPHMWDILLQVLFWLTPVLYVYTPRFSISEDMARLIAGELHLDSLWAVFDLFIRFQPFSIILHDARRALLYTDALGMPSVTHILAMTFSVIIVFCAGAIVFQRRSKYFLQEY